MKIGRKKKTKLDDINNKNKNKNEKKENEKLNYFYVLLKQQNDEFNRLD